MNSLSGIISSQTKSTSSLASLKSVRVLAVSGGKGGVGKSNVTINLAIALAQRQKKVMVLDADLGLANIDIMLGLHTKYNLSHVIQGVCALKDIIVKGPGNISVIPASSGTEGMTNLSLTEYAGIIDAFNELIDDLDYMIIDTAAGISEAVLSFLRSSHEIIVVVCDEPTSLMDAYALIKIMNKRYEWLHFHILANMVHHKRLGRQLYEKLAGVCVQFLDIHLNYLGAIPFDEHIHEAIKKQQPLLLAYPDAVASRSFRRLSHEINNNASQEFVSCGNTSFFLERMIRSK